MQDHQINKFYFGFKSKLLTPWSFLLNKKGNVLKDTPSMLKFSVNTAMILPDIIRLLALKLCSLLLCIVSEGAHPTPTARTSAQLL